MRIVLISDAHGLHRQLDVPSGDLLVHAGDFTFNSEPPSVASDVNAWLGALLMTKDELIERALREAGVFPPSVMDCHYGDRRELTRAELIVKSLEEMGMLSLSEQDPRVGEKIRRIPILVAGLPRRLPDGDIVTCGAFSAPNVGCCNVCHTDPLHGMRLVELPCCGWAELCCSVDAASAQRPNR
jgi:hypothetical protein